MNRDRAEQLFVLLMCLLAALFLYLFYPVGVP